MCNISPQHSDEVICVFATDDNYALYSGVAIQSIISNASKNNKYVIYILEENLSPIWKKSLYKLATKNVRIDFINIQNLLSGYTNDVFYTHSHFSKATYYRFFIPKIFNNFKKIIYLDCDLIVNTDIENLFSVELENNYVGCVNSGKYKSDEMVDYIKSLGLKDPYKYFNSGVIVFDINKLKASDFTNKCINILKSRKNFALMDQDVLNIVFEGNIKFLDASWNVFNNCLFRSFQKNNLTKENEIYYQYLEKCAKNPNIMHYNSNLKPWNTINLINSKFFWKYAIQTPFCVHILFHIISKKLNFVKVFISQIFSVKNEYQDNVKRKILTILGIKMKFKLKPKTVATERE